MVQRNADAIGLLEDLMADLESKLDVAPGGDPLAPERGEGNTEPQHAQATTPRDKTAATAAIDGDVRVIPFCVPLPSPGAAAAGGPAEGVVGTITLRGPSAVVWFGWGAVEAVGADGGGAGAVADDGLAAGNGRPALGSLALAVPPRPGRGGPAPTSRLLGGDGAEDAVRGEQIAARLAARVGWPIFAACALGGPEELLAGHDDDEDARRRAAALAEREAGRILLREKARLLQRERSRAQGR